MKVTERAAVSIGTVSRALNNDIHVAPDARECVSVVICELGYVANLLKSILTNISFPLVLIDHQGTGSLYPDVGAQYGMPAEEPALFAFEEIQGVNVLAESKFSLWSSSALCCIDTARA